MKHRISITYKGVKDRITSENEGGRVFASRVSISEAFELLVVVEVIEVRRV